MKTPFVSIALVAILFAAPSAVAQSTPLEVDECRPSALATADTLAATTFATTDTLAAASVDRKWRTRSPRSNTLTIGAGGSFTSQGQLMIPTGVAYRHYFTPDGLSVGCRAVWHKFVMQELLSTIFGSIAYGEGEEDPNGNFIKQDIVQCMATAAYDLNVVRERFYIGCEVGAGVGYHIISHRKLHAPADMHNRLLPCLSARICFKFRVSDAASINISPILHTVSPTKLYSGNSSVASQFTLLSVGCEFRL